MGETLPSEHEASTDERKPPALPHAAERPRKGPSARQILALLTAAGAVLGATALIITTLATIKAQFDLEATKQAREDRFIAQTQTAQALLTAFPSTAEAMRQTASAREIVTSSPPAPVTGNATLTLTNTASPAPSTVAPPARPSLSTATPIPSAPAPSSVALPTVTPIHEVALVSDVFQALFPSGLPECTVIAQGPNAVRSEFHRLYESHLYPEALGCAWWLYEDQGALAQVQQSQLLAAGQCWDDPSSRSAAEQRDFLARYQALINVGDIMQSVGYLYSSEGEYEQALTAFEVATERFYCAWVDEGNAGTWWNVGHEAPRYRNTMLNVLRN